MATGMSSLAWSKWQSILRSRLWLHGETNSAWRPLLCPRSNPLPAMATYTRITEKTLLKLTGQWGLCRDLTGHPTVGLCGQSFRTLSNQTTSSSNSEYEMAKPFASIPGPKGISSIPYIGTRFLFKPFSKYTVEEFGHLVFNLHETYGPIVRVRKGPVWVVALADIADIQAVINLEDKAPYRPPILIQYMYEKRNKLRPSLSTSNGEEWKRLRTPLNARMNRPSSATYYLASQEQVAVDFAARLPSLQSSPSTLQEEFFRYAAENMGVVCYNKRLGFLGADVEMNGRTNKLLTCFKHINHSLSKSIRFSKFLYLFFEDSFYKNFAAATDYVSSFSLECIDDALTELQRKERDGTSIESNLLYSLLLEKELVNDDILHIMSSLLISGSESTACGLQMILYLLATNPDKQEKLAQEILGEIGQDGSLTVDVLGRLSYLKASVKESMRIYYPLPGGPERMLSSNIVLGGYKVPEGTSVMISSCHSSMNPNYFETPQKFLPERWLRGEDRQRQKYINNLANIPFGFGTRICIGRRLAEQELYLCTVKVLQKYKVGIQENFKGLETKFDIFCTPKTAIPFTFTPRN